MALLVLTAAGGSPGTTTLALGLALTWPRPVMLVDADPGAYQAVLAGFLGGRVRTSKGLQRVAEAHRDRRPLREVVMDQTIDLSDDPTTSRRLLPGFAKAANAALFGPVWPDLADAFARLDLTGIDVILDAGRLGPAGLPQPLVERADVCALVTRTTLRSLAGTRSYAGSLAEQGRLSGAGDNVGVVTIGDDQPYGRREIAKLLRIPVFTGVPDDAVSAAAIVEGGRRARRFDTAPLPKALPHVISDLQTVIQRRRSRLAGLDSHASLPDEVGSSSPGAPVPLPSAPRVQTGNGSGFGAGNQAGSQGQARSAVRSGGGR